MTTLNLKKQSHGYYANTVDKMTITVSDQSVVVGGKSQWQITIVDGDEIVLSEFCATKRECYKIGVKFLMDN